MPFRPTDSELLEALAENHTRARAALDADGPPTITTRTVGTQLPTGAMLYGRRRQGRWSTLTVDRPEYLGDWPANTTDVMAELSGHLGELRYYSTSGPVFISSFTSGYVWLHVPSRVVQPFVEALAYADTGDPQSAARLARHVAVAATELLGIERKMARRREAPRIVDALTATIIALEGGR